MAKELEAVIKIAGELSPTLAKSIDGVKNKLGGINKKALAVGAAAGAAAVAVGKVAVKAGEYLLDLGTEYDKAADSMAASTGLVGENLNSLESAMKGVYGNNFGESMQDAADGVAEAYRNTGLLGSELQTVTEGAFALRDTFGYEITESTRAAKAMMTNFGISGEEAMDLIAAGAQKGLDFSGELIDTINEYSVQFAKIGLSADDMFNVFQAGAESGAWNLDKVGDAVKEFSIRAIDGSKTTIDAYNQLGLNADEMMQTFAKGGDEANAAFKQVAQALIDLEDPVQRDAVGVELFGTMWEDLGVEAVAAMANASDAAYSTGDALEKLSSIKYDNVEDAMQGVKRQCEVALLPAAEKVQQAFMDVAPKIQDLLIKAEPIIAALGDFIAGAIEGIVPVVGGIVDLIAPAFDGLSDAFGSFVDNLPAIAVLLGGVAAALVAFNYAAIAAKGAQMGLMIATKLQTAAQTVFNAVMNANPIGLVILAITALVAAFIYLWNNSEGFRNFWIGLWESIKSAVSTAISFISGAIQTIAGVVSSIVGVIVSMGSSVISAVSSAWSTVRSVTSSIWNGIVSTISGIWNNLKAKASAMVSSVKSVISSGFSALKSIMLAPFNAVINIVGKVSSAIGGVIGKISSVGSSIASKIPFLASGGFTQGVSIAGEAGTEAVISFDPKYRSENIGYWAKAGRMLGVNVSTFALSGSSGGNYYDMGGVTFAPNITVTGNTDKQTIMDAIEAEYPEFIDMLEDWWAGRGAPAYG